MIFQKRYYVLFVVLCTLLLVGLITGYKLFVQEPTYVYIKLKVNQGLWWAFTEKPPFWYTQAIQKGDTAYDFLGKPEAEVLDKKTYLLSDMDAYNIYLTLKIKVNKTSNSYVYNRSVVSIGAPIEVQFPKETVSGTIIGLSRHTFKELPVKKTLFLQKQNAYLWEYDAIRIGDIVTDGTNTIFTVEDKNFEATNQLSVDTNGTVIGNATGTQGTITIKAKIRVKKVDNEYIYGEEKVVKPGRSLDVSLHTFSLKDFIVRKIQ